MSPFRYRDDDSSHTGTIVGALVGAVAGFAVGMLVAQKVGGFSGLASRLRRRGLGAERPGAEPYDLAAGDHDEYDEYDDFESDELEDEGDDEEGELLEERVLEAFRNDPILAERPIDIGGVGDTGIELAGWVDTDEEADHAVTLARGVPGVQTVVNRLMVGEEEQEIDDAARKFAADDAALRQAHWEGQQVGTGRRRQGTSTEPDRHADPKVDLGDRWLSESEAIRHAADDTAGLAERRQRAKKAVKGDRTGGAPVAPTGVPKADHVANPQEADRSAPRADAARETTGERTDFGQQP